MIKAIIHSGHCDIIIFLWYFLYDLPVFKLYLA